MREIEESELIKLKLQAAECSRDDYGCMEGDDLSWMALLPENDTMGMPAAHLHYDPNWLPCYEAANAQKTAQASTVFRRTEPTPLFYPHEAIPLPQLESMSQQATAHNSRHTSPVVGPQRAQARVCINGLPLCHIDGLPLTYCD